MARQSGNSLFSSLRGKIWVSTSVLAFFICTFGLISYLVVSLLINDAFYGVFIPFLFLAFTVLIFGWWLSNEVVNPIENVTLLAKSLERSSSTSIPRTSGSTETDQLLQTIQRNNQQLQKIVTLMDKVANGNLDVTPMQGSDRLSTSFQKLLAKVSESIHAKEELDELRDAVNSLKMDVSGVRTGNLNVEIRSDSALTKDLSETYRYLIENLVRLITAVKHGSVAAESSAEKVEEKIEALIQRDESRIQGMGQASVTLKQVPNLINKISDDLMGSAKSAQATIQKARHGTTVADQNSRSVSNLRKQVREDVKRIQSLNERSHDIERVAKTVEDLANRTNMIALNASIQATEMGEDGHGFVLVAEEVERLAARANGTNKQISTLNKSILAEISKVENSIETTIGEVASLSKFAIETGNVLNEMERYVTQFLNLQESLIAYSKDQSEETDNAFKTFAESISETEESVEVLVTSNSELREMAKVMKELKSSISEFRLPDESETVVDGPAPSDFNSEMNEDEHEHTHESPGEYNTEAFNAVRMDTQEFNSMQDLQGYSESDADLDLQSEDDADTGQQNENFLDNPDSFDSLELAGDQYQELTEDGELSMPVDDEFDSLELSDMDEEFDEFPSEFRDSPENMSSKDAESAPEESGDDDEVLDLYNASLTNDPEPSVFDSGEFAADELIQEVDAESEELSPHYNAPETTALDADELDDLLDPDSFDESPSSDNQLPA
ncbi:MAG: hypothetical protein HKN33_15315 [Pyrinomonadaceae bacterium]|nr:hypothetical protein [Pyrinomonadaceae bacterium]